MTPSDRLQFLILNGSPKPDGYTAALASKFIKATQAFGECELVHLYQENIPFVTGELGKPIEKPSALQEKLRACDAFVLVTPTYWFNMPAVVKNFIDHLTILEDNDYLLEGKAAGVIVYTPEGGGETILQNLSLIFNHMGIVIPPYCLIYDRGDNASWVEEDIPLMAQSLTQQVQAQKKYPFSWNIE